MSQTTKVSVCMATYNGEKFIEEQLKSILSQLGDNDEVVVVDDCSSDSTIERINSFNDKRIIVFRNKNNIGHIKSFEKAILYSKGDLVFMSDQDDIWAEGRYKLFVDLFENKNKCVISGNTLPIDQSGALIDFNLGFLSSRDSYKYKKNLLKIFFGKAYYYGCAMAFSANLKQYILPFPEKLQCHDLWIAGLGNLLKCNYHLDDYVLKRRIHGKNASVLHNGLIKKIAVRFIYLKNYNIARKRCKRIKYEEI